MEKMKKVNLRDDSAHIAELISRYVKGNKPFQFVRDGKVVKEISDPVNQMDIINKVLEDE